MPLADALSGASPCGKVVVPPSSMTTMWSADKGFQVGVRARLVMDAASQGVFARPVDREHPKPFAMQWLLRSDNAADQSWLSEQYGVEPPPVGDAPCAATELVPQTTPQKAASKLAKRWEGIAMECNKTLRAFATEQWEQAKESAFTKH